MSSTSFTFEMRIKPHLRIEYHICQAFLAEQVFCYLWVRDAKLLTTQWVRVENILNLANSMIRQGLRIFSMVPNTRRKRSQNWDKSALALGWDRAEELCNPNPNEEKTLANVVPHDSRSLLPPGHHPYYQLLTGI